MRHVNHLWNAADHDPGLPADLRGGKSHGLHWATFGMRGMAMPKTSGPH